jgi:hypothetical protein
LKEFVRCEQLRELDLVGSANLSDADLKGLAALKQLRRLDLAMCPKLTQAALHDLQAALPDCVIHGLRGQ